MCGARSLQVDESNQLSANFRHPPAEPALFSFRRPNREPNLESRRISMFLISLPTNLVPGTWIDPYACVEIYHGTW